MVHISNHYVNAAIKGALAKGIDKHSLLRRAGIQANQLAPQGQVTPQQLNILYKLLWAELQDEFFGLGLTPCKFGYFRLLASHHPQLKTLRDVLEYSATFFSITRDDVIFETQVNEHTSTLSITIDCAQTDPDCFLREYHLIGWQRYLSWLIGVRIQPIRTGLNFPKPKHCALYPYFFDGKITFNQPTCHIVFESSLLDCSVIRSFADLQNYLISLPLPVFYRPIDKQPVTSRVEQVLKHFSPCALPSLDKMADELNIKKRTLHRKLNDENTHYRKIISEYRLHLAIDLLTKQYLSVNATSLALGFSEPAAFCHFFKRQAGLSPKQYTQFNAAMILKSHP